MGDILLCYKCGSHWPYDIACPNSDLHFYVEGPSVEFESQLKEHVHNEEQFHEEFDCGDDGMIEGYILMVKPWLGMPKARPELEECFHGALETKFDAILKFQINYMVRFQFP